MKKIVLLGILLLIVSAFFFIFTRRVGDCEMQSLQSGALFYNSERLGSCSWGFYEALYRLSFYQLKQETEGLSPRLNAFKNTALAVKLRRYHGRESVELHESNDKSEKIIDICNEINSKLSNKGFNKCLFDLGSSIIYSQRFWPMPLSLLRKEIDRHVHFCMNLKAHISFRYDCISGIYNGLNLAYLEPDNHLPYKKNDPFWLCSFQKEYDLKIRCTRALVASLYSLEKKDIKRIVGLINNLKDEKERRETLLTFFSSLVYQEIPKDEIYKLCLGFNLPERQLCLTGYGTGLIETSLSGEEEESIVRFCINESFSKSEIGDCLRRSFFDLQSFYPDQREGICLKNVPFEFREFCNFSWLDTGT